MESDFDSWNIIKKRIEAEPREPKYFPQNGEVWICSLGKNIGSEQNGGLINFSRPVLIVKKFNNQLFWVVPLSTKQKQRDFYFNYVDAGNKKVSVILVQLKLLSGKRFIRKLYNLPNEKLYEIKQRLQNFLR